jgi:hypothetical protein
MYIGKFLDNCRTARRHVGGVIASGALCWRPSRRLTAGSGPMRWIAVVVVVVNSSRLSSSEKKCKPRDDGFGSKGQPSPKSPPNTANVDQSAQSRLLEKATFNAAISASPIGYASYEIDSIGIGK